MAKPSEKSKNDVNDSDLVRAINRGRQDLFYELVKRYEKVLYNFGLRMCDNPSDAEDMVQDTFLNVFKYLEGFRYETKFKNWLYRVATNLGYNALRGNQRRTRREDVAASVNPLTVPSAATEAERNLEQAEVRAALSRLKPRNGQLLLLRHMGFSYQELAVVFNVSPNSIGTLLARAEKAFSRVYRQYAG